MLGKREQGETREPSDDVDPLKQQSTAKRIGNFATNLLVTGVILITGIAFGREVILWWRTDDTQAALPSAANVGPGRVPVEPGELQLLEFGDFPFALNRQEFVGDASSVLGQLRETSRSAIDSSPALTAEITAAERRMLAAAERLQPVEQLAKHWAIYQIEVPVPMVIGTRNTSEDISAFEWRVVSWGMAVPNVSPADEPQSNWTLFTYTSDAVADDKVGGEKIAEVASFTPPGGRRTVSLRTDHGGAIIGYAGDADVAAWTEFYQALFGDQPDDSRSEWQVERGIWRRRFVTESLEIVDVVISPDAGGSLRCLVITSRKL